MGAALLVQGFLSYMNDVHTWGQQGSLWKVADVVCASSLTATQLGIVAAYLGGLMHFPPYVGRSYGALVVGGLCLKVKSSLALKTPRECHVFLVWHTAWHLVALLPVVACIATGTLRQFTG